MRPQPALMLLGLLVASPAALGAQTGGKFAVGADLSTRVATSRDADGRIGVGLLWRIGHAKTGWGWHWGLSWISTNLTEEIGGTTIEFGELHVRPVMAGYGYTRVFGRTAVTAQLIGGYAFTTMSLTPAARIAFRERLGADAVTAKASNTVAFKPEVSAWRNINRRIGVRISAGYLVARPHVTTTSTAGRNERIVRADMLMFKAGVVYSIF